MSAIQTHVEGTEHDALLNEALPLLHMDFKSRALSEFHGGEQFLGADHVVMMCAERGIRLSDEAMTDLELDATDSLDDDWHTYRHYAARSLDFIAQIRALDNA
ncbi:MAG: hypothetical protein SO046_04485 [Actinomyces urogenitalis]|uniref:hypothetical protein n=1 Tax=Actinomyces urogenitalis TaxID=103621 RepID=UPI002A83A8D7|nr:hypothetical protein [Actinomyces urogenitalis]MDY3678459.1 hypothetical protein [Actinomyces urogenitalis]